MGGAFRASCLKPSQGTGTLQAALTSDEPRLVGYRIISCRTSFLLLGPPRRNFLIERLVGAHFPYRLRKTSLRQPLDKPLASVAILSPEGARTPVLEHPFWPQVVLSSNRQLKWQGLHPFHARRCFRRRLCLLELPKSANTGPDCLARKKSQSDFSRVLRPTHRSDSRPTSTCSPLRDFWTRSWATTIEAKNYLRSPKAFPRLVRIVKTVLHVASGLFSPTVQVRIELPSGTSIVSPRVARVDFRGQKLNSSLTHRTSTLSRFGSISHGSYQLGLSPISVVQLSSALVFLRVTRVANPIGRLRSRHESPRWLALNEHRPSSLRHEPRRGIW